MRLCNYFLLFLTLIQSYNAHVRDKGPEDELYEVKPTNISADVDSSVLLKIDPLDDFVLTIPEECLEIGICEHIPNYPQEKISNIIKTLSKKNIKLNNDDEIWEDVKNMQNNKDQNYEDLCPSMSKLYYPQAARDIHKRWHLILNSKETPQSVFGNICKDRQSHPGSCSSTAFIERHYYGECRQEFFQKNLIGLDEIMENVKIIPHRIFTCCACQVFEIH